MDEKELRATVTSTGLELLRDRLVARTWGNISARVDDKHFLITPSGLDYVRTTDEDLALVDRTTMEWTGKRKPSSEKGIHAAAYDIFPDAGFVIHTHQVYASAIGVAGFESLDITEAERKQLGGIAKASYGLPGTGKLKDAVKKVLEAGNHTVLMQNHGVLVVASTKEKAYANAVLLEEICKRNMRFPENTLKKAEDIGGIINTVRESHPHALAVTTEAAVLRSFQSRPLIAQLDDMAQMIGRSINVVERSAAAVLKELEAHNAVFIKGCGAIVCGDDEDDTEALKILLDKAAVTDLNAGARGMNRKLGMFDCMLMRFVYKKKYSKKKNA